MESKNGFGSLPAFIRATGLFLKTSPTIAARLLSSSAALQTFTAGCLGLCTAGGAEADVATCKASATVKAFISNSLNEARRAGPTVPRDVGRINRRAKNAWPTAFIVFDSVYVKNAHP